MLYVEQISETLVGIKKYPTKVGVVCFRKRGD